MWFIFPLGVCCIQNTPFWNFELCHYCLQLRIYEARPSTGLQGPQRCGIGLFDNLYGVRPIAPLNYGLHAISLTLPGLELMTTPLALVKLLLLSHY